MTPSGHTVVLRDTDVIVNLHVEIDSCTTKVKIRTRVSDLVDSILTFEEVPSFRRVKTETGGDLNILNLLPVF